MVKPLFKVCVLLFAFILNVGALSHSEDNILYFFPQAKRDGLNIIWAHDLNSQTKLTQALEGSAMMLEADVSLRDRGKPNQVPIMSPNSMTPSDITLEQWIDMVTRYTNKGIKLDFKDVQAVQPALDILLLKEAQLRVPLFFHADIIAGPNGQNSVDLIQPTEFIAIVNTMFPNATFSLGFVSSASSGLNQQDRYTWTMIFDMLDTSSTVTTHPITFNFRAVWANKSWQKFVWLLGLTNRFSVTIWSKATDPLNTFTGLEELRNNGDKRRIFYDLAPQHLARFKTDLSFVTPTTAAPNVWNRNLWEGNANALTSGYIYLSAEGAAIVGDSYPGYIQTIDMWKPSKDGLNPLIVRGQIQFVNRNMQKAPGPASTEIIIRASPMSEGPVIVPIKGIKCAIEDTGRIYVQDLMSHYDSLDKMITPADCYSFEILDNGQEVTFNVKVVQCSDSDLRPTYIDSVSIVFENVTHIEVEDSLVQFTKSGDMKNVVLEDVSVQGKKFNRKRGNQPPNNLGNDNRPLILTTFLSVVSLILLKIFT
ncbi:uncharacterized protein LOC117116409 [Anneissia japonica]|uniref:uncharacterized protein LOC117116409 n=1 Tax=Anneissia japonica TaxID=1529436 RepID=UPI0014255BA8|nr:uncharacterized protein LOC117116409 [Anneissia japonica]